MKILFCGLTFPKSAELLTTLLPLDGIMSCPGEEVAVAGLDADVIVPLMHRLERDLIGNTRARMIHQWGVGLEGVDIELATSRGIAVCNVPGDATANADSTAEHAIFLMMGVARRIHGCFRALREGSWGTPLGEALFGDTALIVGLGKVGQALARKLRSLGMTVTAIKRTRDSDLVEELDLEELGDPSDLYDMASTADFVISTAVLNDETRGLFNMDLFKAMKTCAFVINVSRGPVVDEGDLIKALRSRTIAGAGLDVFCQEPVNPDNPLLAMENVFVTPHVAGVTRQNYVGIGRIVADNILLVKAGAIPKYCVNPQVFGN